MARAQLHLQSIPQLLRQAALSWKASMQILLIVALLSSVYETAIDNVTDLSGFSFNFTNANYSVEFGKTNSQSRVDEKGHEVKPGEMESLLGRLLSALLAPMATHETNESLNESIQKQTDKKIPDNRAEIQGNDGLARTEGLRDEKNEDERGIQEGNEEKQPHDLETESKSGPDEKPNETEMAQNNPNELKIESEMTQNADNKTAEEEKEVIRSNLVGSFKMVDLFGNETKKKSGQKLRKPQLGAPSGTGVFNQGAMPAGIGEGTLILLLLLILAGSVIFLLVLAFRISAVLGVVAYTVASTHLGKRASIKQSLKVGLKTGLWRLIWFVVLHWTLHEIQVQFLAKLLFGNLLEKDQIDKLVMRLLVMPFAALAPWKDEFATGVGMSLRIGAFVSLQYLFDWLVYSTYIVGCWIVIVERQYSNREALNRGWNLVKSMAFQAATIKVLEAVFCGRSISWVLNKVGGQIFATFILSVVQTYFIVLWLIFYLAARYNENQGETQQFSHRDLEDFLDKFR